MTTNNTPPPAHPAAQETSENPPPRQWVILIVDDEQDVRNSLTELLEKSIPGTKVLAAASGRKGLDILERERVDLIMSDQKMPGMDGIEFLVQARRMRPRLPRMMFTAFADKTLASRAVAEAVVDEFLAKNVTPKDTVRLVERLLRYSPESSSDAEETPAVTPEKRVAD
jgi:CheY-like chemotaxis protein